MSTVTEKIKSIYKRHIKNQIGALQLVFALSLRPADNLDIPDWAERSLYFSHRVSPTSPGMVRLLPYQREPLKALKYVNRVVCCWGAQTGKTVMLQCFLAYIPENDPGPVMVIYPDQDTGKRRSRKYLRPMFEDSPCLKQHLTGDKNDMQIFEYKLDNCVILLAWSGSPSQLAGESIRYLLRDEIGKFAGATKKEADSMSLSERRTIRFSYLARIFDVTTPNLKDAAGWDDLIKGTFEKFHVPCPHCGKKQVLVFKQFKYPAMLADEKQATYEKRVLNETYYQCEHCPGKITDMDKMSMLEGGEWIAENPDASYRSFHLPSWYATWVKFNDVALRFIQAKDDPEKLHDWVNSDCAEPWEQQYGQNISQNEILKHCLDYERGKVPVDGPVIMVMTVDVQKDHFWFTVRAHQRHRSFLVECGAVASWSDLENIQQKRYLNTKDEPVHQVRLTFLDSRYRTTEVYLFCASHERTFATMGDVRNIPVTWKEVDHYPGEEKKKLVRAIKRFDLDKATFCEDLLTAINEGKTEEGGFEIENATWFLYKDTPENYAHQLTAMIVIEDIDKNGGIKRTWKQIRKADHLFDCEYIQRAVRWMMKNELETLDAPPPPSDQGPSVSYQDMPRGRV